MSSQVVRIQSFNKGSLSGIGKEVEREKKDQMENRNKDIDKERTPLNEFYKHTKNGMFGEWKDICKDLNVINAGTLKKNATAFEGMIITSNKEFFEKLGYIAGQEPPAKVKEFFDQSYEFAKQEIGFKGTDQNILTASIHYDETTPHLQLYYVPVVDSWKEKVYEKDDQGKVLKNENGSPIQARDEKGKIIYNTVLDSEERRLNRTQFWQNKGGKASYSRLQDRFYEQISKEFGLGRGEKGSTKEHTTKAQWEAKQLDKELNSKAKELSSNEKKIDKLKNELEYAKDGSVAIPQLASKQKTAEIQEQNKALRVEVKSLSVENRILKYKVEDLETYKQSKLDALKDRTSVDRQALDALDHEKIYKEFLRQMREKKPELKGVLTPVEELTKKVHDFGRKLVEHKQNYVECLESRKIALESISDAQVRKTTFEGALIELEAIRTPLIDTRGKLEELKQEREDLTPLQIIKKIDCEKQIKHFSEKIKGFESTLRTKFEMKTTDQVDIEKKISHFEEKLEECRHEIDEKSLQADQLSSKAQESIKDYKLMVKSTECLQPIVKGIVQRYYHEYDPPKDYKKDFEPYAKQGKIRGRGQEKAELESIFEDWKSLMDQGKVDKMLEDPYVKPRIEEVEQEQEQPNVIQRRRQSILEDEQSL